MKKAERKINISLAVCALLCCTAPVSVILTTNSIFATAVVAAISAAIFLCAAYERFALKAYIMRLLTQLSDLIQTISDYDGREVFPELDDSLLSKLQNQVSKLTQMLIVRAETSASEKNEVKALISDISHQLKTPVAILKNYGDLLADKTISESEKTEYLEAFEKALAKLTFLTESMIKMSRLESGVIELFPVRASLNETVLAAVMQEFAAAKKKNVEIIFDSDICRVETVHDKRWTAEAIFNILDNAVKYSSPEGNVRIVLQKYEMFARLDISDNGIGIAPEETEKIFQRFYRGKNTVDYEGVGIGLYLSRKIVSDQGGYIKVMSSASKTTFSIFLPL